MSRRLLERMTNWDRQSDRYVNSHIYRVCLYGQCSHSFRISSVWTSPVWHSLLYIGCEIKTTHISFTCTISIVTGNHSLTMVQIIVYNTWCLLDQSFSPWIALPYSISFSSTAAVSQCYLDRKNILPVSWITLGQ